MGQRSTWCFVCLLACIWPGQNLFSQSGTRDRQEQVQSGQLPLISFTPADSFDRRRFWVASGATAVGYGGTVVALNEAWYKQFPRTSFHFYDDSREWLKMDKVGHVYTTYFETAMTYRIARWTGMNENQAIWSGVALGLLFQNTVEVLDGFSAEWGFSVTDASFNLLGSGAFLAQQKAWGEQRIVMKVSSTPVDYPEISIDSESGNATTTLKARTEELFGKSYPARFLKDYNAQTNWVSLNIASFLKPESRFPKWLNVAVGYGGENLFGGQDNSWDLDGEHYMLSEDAFPRYSQWYLSPDIDFTKIPARSPFTRTLLGILNVFKMPGPVLEWNSQDGIDCKLRW